MMIGTSFVGGLHRKMGRIVVLFLLIGAWAEIRAQLPTATVLGVVKDASGAVVPDAALTVRNVETGQTRIAASAADGSYRFSALPVGTYEIRAAHTGFQSELRSGLTLTVLQEAVVSFTLRVGAVEQTIAVTAEAPLVNTTTGSLGGLVDAQKVSDLPLNGRNYLDLTLLQPGVQQHKNINYTGGMSGIWFSSNGAPVRSNDFLLDGAIMQNFYGTSTASISNTTLGVEGIREYRVITNSFTAEYGLTMGSQAVIVSKGGTNSFHGSALEFLRNSALDARNFFDLVTPTNPRRLPAFARNQFGASFGGPVKKDKLFFYGVYEGVRERLGRTIISNVIPATAKVDGGAGGVAQIALVIKPLLGLYPDANLPGNQFTFPYSQPTREDYGQMRVDDTISGSDSLFVRHTIDDTVRTQPIDYPQFKAIGLSRSQYATLSENHIFSANLLNTARFSYSRTVIRSDSPSGLTGPQYSFVTGQEMGSIAIGGIATLGPDTTSPGAKLQNLFTWSDDLFYTRGRHSFKIGTLINRFRVFMLNGTNTKGSVTFPNLSSFLLAQPSTYRAVTPGSRNNRTYNYSTLGFYVQDDVRVHPRFTLNLGLRYEFLTTVHEVRGYGAALRDMAHDADTTLGIPFINPSLHNFSPRFGFAWDVKGDGKTAVRGGFGLLYDLGNVGSALSAGAGATPPFSLLSTVNNPPLPFTLPLVIPASAAGKALRVLDYNLRQPHLLQFNLAVERQLPHGMAVTLAYAGSRGLNLFKVTEGNPTIPRILPDNRQFWSGTDPRTNPNWTSIELKTAGSSSWYNSMQLGAVKRLTKGLEFQSSYTWSKITDQTQGQLTNEDSASNAFGSNPTRPSTDKAPADFDLTHNWRMNAIYHFPNPGFSSGFLAKLLSGWWTSGIFSLQTGYPITPNLQTNRSRSQVNSGGAGIDRPNLAAGRNNGNIVSGASTGCIVNGQGVAAGRPLGTPRLYFDPCAFTIPEIGFLGNAGRGILRGPGIRNLDFSLVKDTALKFLGEGGKLQFRAEVFNILNHANLATPALAVFAARANAEAPLNNAGQINNTTGAARQIQLALKIVF